MTDFWVVDEADGFGKVRVISFGYLHAPAPDAEITVDLRAVLHNPADDPTMRERTGLERRVIEHVMATPGSAEIIDALIATVRAYVSELDRRFLAVTVAVGCAGGRHRSVVIANAVGHLLRRNEIPTYIEHRDVARPVVTGNGTAHPDGVA